MAAPSYPSHDWQPVTHGMSGDRVWRLTGPSQLYVKRGAQVCAEAARLDWLAAQGFPAAAVVDVSDDWLVTAAMPGRAAHEPWAERERPAVIDAIARLARDLHTLDVASCPFDRTGPADVDLVVCHGDLCLPNVLIDPDSMLVTGIVDVARLGVTDRYVDLAIATRSIAVHPANTQFGPPMADRFLETYGEPEPDEIKIAAYRALDDAE